MQELVRRENGRNWSKRAAMGTGRVSFMGKKLKLVSVIACALVLASCAATFQNHGYIPPQEDLALIVPGVDTRDSVAENLGRPAASGVMRDEAWFYTAYQVRNYAYRAPEVIEREILAISFADNGTVTNIEEFGLEDGQVVQLSRRVTESTVRELSFFTQLIGNFGRINIGEALAGN